MASSAVPCCGKYRERDVRESVREGRETGEERSGTRPVLDVVADGGVAGGRGLRVGRRLRQKSSPARARVAGTGRLGLGNQRRRTGRSCWRTRRDEGDGLEQLLEGLRRDEPGEASGAMALFLGGG